MKESDKDKDDVLLEDPKGGSEKKPSKIKYFLLLGISLVAVIIFFAILLSTMKTNEVKKDGNDWKDSYRKAEQFVSKLNRTEKLGLLYGTENMKFLYPQYVTEEERDKHCVGEIDKFKNDKVEFKGMCLQDGPAGIRFVKGTSISWQSALNTASTFNKTLMYLVGKAQGEENKEKGINAFLSPCVNIMRTPQAGRVWEAFGEDPFYSGVCATQVVKGIQDAGVIATIKHFVGNDQETYRHASSSNIDKAPLMDIYVEPFYRPIHEANVGSVMSCYNAVNNTYCAENKELLTNILRGILDFKGFVVSDWWSIYNNHSDNFNSGLDMNMPGGYSWGEYFGRDKSYWSMLEDYEEKKIIGENRITESATRIIATMYQLNQMENFPDIHMFHDTKTEERKKLQRDAATESQILLKNQDDILPLKDIKTIAVIGNAAFERDCIGESDFGCVNETNLVVNGHIPLGYGSGTTDFSYLIPPIQGIEELAKKKGIEVLSSGKLIYTDEIREIKGEKKTVHVSAKEDIESGVEIAKKADVAIVFVKADSGEEYLVVESSTGDRIHLDAWHEGNDLIESIAKVNKNIIVVINAPAVINVPWLDKVKAVVFSGFSGAESGHAIADILFGEVYPSGHLPYAWGGIDDYGTKITHLVNYSICETGQAYAYEYKYEGVDSAGRKDDRPGHEKEQYDYTEGLYVGQRWFNKQNKKPIFPFGHGLTFTKFEYTGLKVSLNKDGLTAEFKLKNVGKVIGQAVPMMFLTFPDSVKDYPKHIFKGFDKIELKPDEIKTVTIVADDHALSYFNVEQNKYVRVKDGKIKVCIAENGDPDQVILRDEIDSKF